MAIDVAQYLALSFLGNTVQQYVTSALVFILVLGVMRIFKSVIINRVKAVFKRTKTKVDDLVFSCIETVGWSFYVIVSLFVATQFVALPAVIPRMVYYVLIINAIYYSVKALIVFIDFGADHIAVKRQKLHKDADTSIIDLLKMFLKIAVWGLAVVLILSNLGIDIAPLLAGVGVGGIAIAFALQNVLTDVFSSISIYFDKPFQKGDYIVIGGDSGTVKKIGIKSTRIQTLQGQELVVSNKELTEARVNNYKKMKKRRAVFTFGVTYDTPVKKLKKIPGIIKKILDKEKLTELDRVHFKDFGDFSLNYEVVYYLTSKEYGVFMDIQQEINLTLLSVFEKEKIEMAFPTQTVYVNKLK